MAVKYNCGSGPNRKEGMINVDKFAHQCDLKADMLTMTYEPADHIESHHSFEHLGYVDSFFLLVKWTEALVDGGTLMIDVPDPVAILERMKESTDPHVHASGMRLIYGSQEADWAKHINGWTPIWLGYVLELFGYVVKDCRRYSSGGENFPNCGIEITATKGCTIERSDLVHQAHILLGYYLHPSETGLHAMYCNQFDRRLG